MTWPARRLCVHGDTTGISYADLETMSIDECEVANRYLDAVLEAEYIRRKRK